MLFYRFISENLKNFLNNEEQHAGNSDFDYALISDEDAEFARAETVLEKGFYILPSELFENVHNKSKNDDNLNETLSTVFKNIKNSAKGTASEDSMKGLFDDIVHYIENEDKEQVEIWFARELQVVLGYARWENFIVAIKRAVTSCNTLGISVDDHFREVTKMVVLGSGAKREVENYMLTRFACYLIAQNGVAQIFDFVLRYTINSRGGAHSG